MEVKVQNTIELEQFGYLPAENVQSLASKNLKNIPSRYIRPDVESDVVSTDESLLIPVIDLSKLDHDDGLKKLHFACKDWGFFQLINHGVPDEVIEKMKTDAQDFFNLPLEEKMAWAQIPNYSEGYGQVLVLSEDQKLDWSDIFYVIPLPVPLRNMRFWPTNPPSFRETLEKYSMELHNVMVQLMKLIAKNLGTDPWMLLSYFDEDEVQGIKLIYYPPCAEASKVLGASPHSDGTGLTLLLQVNEVEGLQFKRNQKWVPVKPIPGALIVNIGDVLEIMSNGKYKSAVHRVVVNPEKERLSIASFHNQKMGTKIGPLQDLVETNKALYRTLPIEEFRRLKMTSKGDGKYLINKMKI
ncbi:S-norcoclaurine synthase 1 [Hibiscus syriacus]|uniref:S-norcoclaurine synthase 1 n=1 Tax=Hibiscus syriacus TaxID=106335 RepID=A0A6A2WN91_HIBSY|nr:S-norcoclaurine synthase 1-like [Hibiscus syriacus]KAE8661863.1 S-norcoclaurine synthase 1 [Hibiscus syriacus]